MEEIAKEKSTISSVEFVARLKTKKKVSNVTVTGKIILKNVDFAKHLNTEIVDCTFLDEVDFVNEKIAQILFLRCTFKKRLLLSGRKFLGTKILQSTFEKYFTFNSFSSQNITIEECKIQNSILTQLQDFECKTLSFRRNISNNDILIKPEKIKSLFIEGNEKNYLITYSGLDLNDPLDEIYLFTFSNYRTDYLIRTLSTKKMQLVGEIKDSILNLNNCKIGQTIIHRFINQGVVIFDLIAPLNTFSTLVVKNSLLGKAQINNTDFSAFKKVILDGSSFIDVIPINVVWCDSRGINAPDLYSLKENYRQLKIVANKNEDNDAKLFFHKLEMRSLLKIYNSKKSTFNDWFILRTNHLSNDFGLNWLYPLGWFIGISVICYAIIKCLIGEIYFKPELIPDEIGKYLIFSNPIHQFEKVFRIDPLVNNTNGALLVDGIYKLTAAYILYQFISSFRKYSKK